MPIKDPTIYPPYWKQFSEYIRFERAGNKCETCGAPNGEVVGRGRFDDFSFWCNLETGSMYSARTGVYLGREIYDLPILRETTIVLTVAHLDHAAGPCRCKEETGRKCARPDHVLALCQACHLALDLPKHIENRRLARMEQLDAGRTLFTEVSA